MWFVFIGKDVADFNALL